MAAVRFFLAATLLTSYHHVVKRRRSDENSRLKEVLVMNNGTCEDVARRAYELFLSRGGQHGRDVDDWLEAERQLTSNGASPRPSRRSASNTGAVKTTVRRRAR